MKRSILSSSKRNRESKPSPRSSKRKRRKSEKASSLELMRKNMDAKKFKKYLVSKIQLLKKEIQMNQAALKKSPTIVLKIKAAELKQKLEETLTFIPKKTKAPDPAQEEEQRSEYKKFIRKTITEQRNNYISKDALLEKVLDEFNITEAELLRRLRVKEFADWLKKDSKIYLDFFGFVNSTSRAESPKVTQTAKKNTAAPRVTTRTITNFNSVFGDAMASPLNSKSKKPSTPAKKGPSTPEAEKTSSPGADNSKSSSVNASTTPSTPPPTTPTRSDTATSTSDSTVTIDLVDDEKEESSAAP